MRALFVALALIIGLAAPAAAQAPAPAAEASPFTDWAGFFIAGDYRAQSGAPSEVFDNGRREMAAAFENLGMARDNIRQFSVRPHRYPDEGVLPALPNPIETAMREVAGRTRAGCLFFFTSHGSPGQAVMGDYMVRPAEFAALLNATCGDRPTVVIISACFSGSFIPDMQGPNRIILAAARPDRTSFGCGESDVYTFFDGCILQELPKTDGFAALARQVRTCVSARETELKVSPPSEPQVFIGATIAGLADTPVFARFHEVTPGETLSIIARRYYGSPAAYARIYEANRQILKNPNAVAVGQKLRIPPAPPVGSDKI